MATSKPSLDLLTELTDENVLSALITEPRLTRAELATLTGISKPTIGDSVRRLTEVGLILDTGERTTGRGRAGSYYALAADVGTALVVSVAPEGVVAEVLDAHGAVTSRHPVPARLRHAHPRHLPGGPSPPRGRQCRRPGQPLDGPARAPARRALPP